MIFIPQPPDILITHFQNNLFIKKQSDLFFIRKKDINLKNCKKTVFELDMKDSFCYHLNNEFLHLKNRIFKFDDSFFIKITKNEFVLETNKNRNIENLFSLQKNKLNNMLDFKIIESTNPSISISTLHFIDSKGTIIHSYDPTMNNFLKDLMGNFRVYFQETEKSYEEGIFSVLIKAKII